MKKYMLSLLLFSVFSVSFFSSKSFAEEVFSEEEVKFIESTNELMGNSDSIISANELEKNGWEIIQSEDDSNPALFSYGSDAELTNYLMKSTDHPGLYLVQAVWYFPESSWDANSGNARDYVGLSITRGGKTLTTSAQYASIKVMNSRGNVINNGWLEKVNGSGAVWTIEDTAPGSIGAYGVGSQGSVWFYIAKPSDVSGETVVKSEWTHTWATNKISLTELTFSYPLSISAKWSSTAGLLKWSTPLQRVYNTWP